MPVWGTPPPPSVNRLELRKAASHHSTSRGVYVCTFGEMQPRRPNETGTLLSLVWKPASDSASTRHHCYRFGMVSGIPNMMTVGCGPRVLE